jgi:hypothetical protein
MDDVVRTVPVTGFDPAGEPSIVERRDGSVYVSFAFLPPSDCEGSEAYFLEHFQKQMEESIGRAVEWEDRELFAIPEPQADTVARVQRFLSTYRETHREALR